MKYSFIILISVLLFTLPGCNNEEPAKESAGQPAAAKPAGQPLPGCENCHKNIQLDANHSLACSRCHNGNDQVSDREEAHLGLIPHPAHPDNMKTSCGDCHQGEVERCGGSLHFTLNNKVNLVRSHFGAGKPVDTLTDIPAAGEPQSELELVDDMLRRRCLRCHVFSSGDNYPYVSRGTGCAACHMQYEEGTLQSHVFIKSPGDRQCLSCHYGNYVGADYHGKFETDYNWEYRTPYTTREAYVRPYGVEQHDLAADIHQQRGLACIDCHLGSALKGAGSGISCLSCHGRQPGDPKPNLAHITIKGEQLNLHARKSGKIHPIPQLKHPAHQQYKNLVDCQVCHGQWSFNDSTTHLLLSTLDDYDAWDRLTVQSSSEIEALLEHNLYSDEDELEPAMRDGITGESRPGIWYKGFTQRRWEDMIIAKDKDGIIKVFRPILDLRLSAIDSDEEVLFDNVKGNGSKLLPYTPHTTGPAGLFYLQRFSHLLHDQSAEGRKQ